MKKKKAIAFPFVLDYLVSADPHTKSFFGSRGVYIGEKLMLILRKKEEDDPDNGIWISTSHEHHQSLKKEFPDLRSIRIFGERESAWRNLPEESDGFESDAMKICQLILRGDARIGRIPAKKKKKKSI